MYATTLLSAVVIVTRSHVSLLFVKSSQRVHVLVHTVMSVGNDMLNLLVFDYTGSKN